MNDKTTDRFNTAYESEFKKGLVPDTPVTPPIVIPQPGSSNSTNSSSTSGNSSDSSSGSGSSQSK